METTATTAVQLTAEQIEIAWIALSEAKSHAMDEMTDARGRGDIHAAEAHFARAKEISSIRRLLSNAFDGIEATR